MLFAAYHMVLLTRGQAHVAAYGLLHVALDCHAVSATWPAQRLCRVWAGHLSLSAPAAAI